MTTEQLTLMVTVTSLLGNAAFLFRLNGIKSYDELVKYWKAESEKKDNQLKEQDDIIRRLHKRLFVYQKFHNHKLKLANEEKKGIS